ncbi:MAG: hypothetical protein KDB27_16300 [Planctomycetales bacterium]|nr:hypothetical protein [Planctomycetales bacterium]
MTPSATRKISIETADGKFVARYDGDATSHFEKARQLYRIGKESGLFVAPQPRGLSANSTTITWEHLPGLRSFRTAFAELSCNDQLSVARQIGAALARIHAELNLEGRQWSCQSIVNRIANSAVQTHVREEISRAAICNVHGDFACANLFLNEGNRLVTLDPEPNIYLFDRAEPSIRASIYLEIALLIQSLHSRRDFSITLGQQLDPVCSEILDGYENEAQQAICRKTTFCLAAEIMMIYREYRRTDGTESWLDRMKAARHRKRAAAHLNLKAQGAGMC